jgi:hypothetical protein
MGAKAVHGAGAFGKPTRPTQGAAAQKPSRQERSDGHATPQAPQFEPSVRGSVQVPPQARKGSGQAALQCPAEQATPDGQARSQDPQ